MPIHKLYNFRKMKENYPLVDLDPARKSSLFLFKQNKSLTLQQNIAVVVVLYLCLYKW